MTKPCRFLPGTSWWVRTAWTPGRAAALAGVDRENSGVWIGGAQRRAIAHAREGMVIGELGRASDFFHDVRPGVGMTDDAQGANRLDIDGGEWLARLNSWTADRTARKQAGIAGATASVAAEGALDLVVRGA